MTGIIPKYKFSLIVSLWQQGLDTADIASRLGVSEAYCYNLLAKVRR